MKTNGEIPKGNIGECMGILRKAVAAAPVRVGDILISNIADTGIDIVATSALE